MKKMVAAALLALAMTGSALLPAGSSAFAQTDQPGQLVPQGGTMLDVHDPQYDGLSNILYTQDNATSDTPSESAPDRCGCAFMPDEEPLL